MATKQQVGAGERERMIAEGAYFLALERGFEGGDPLGDWLNAEKIIDAKFDVGPHDKKLGQLYEQLAEANERVRDLTKKVKAEAREEWREELRRIEGLRDSFSEKLEEIRGLTGEAKQRAKRQADKLRDELTAGLKRIGARREEPK